LGPAAPTDPLVGTRLGNAGTARRQADQIWAEADRGKPALGIELQATVAAHQLGEPSDATGLAQLEPPQPGGGPLVDRDLALAGIARSGLLVARPARSRIAGSRIAGSRIAGSGIAGSRIASSRIASSRVAWFASARVASARVASARIASARIASA